MLKITRFEPSSTPLLSVIAPYIFDFFIREAAFRFGEHVFPIICIVCGGLPVMWRKVHAHLVFTRCSERDNETCLMTIWAIKSL